MRAAATARFPDPMTSAAAGAELQRWLAAIGDGTLPMLGRTVDRLRALAPTAETNLQHVVDAVLDDPGYTLHLFRRVNVQLARSGKPLATLMGQVVRLAGLPCLLDSHRDVPKLDDLPAGRTTRAVRCLYQRSHHAAVQAQEWMLSRGLAHPANVAYVGALLRTVLPAALWLRAPDEARIALAPWASPVSDGVAGLRTIDVAATRLARRWALPPATCPEDDAGEQAQAIARAVVLAGLLAAESERDWDSPALDVIVRYAAESQTATLDEMWALVHRAASKAARAPVDFGRPHPATHLLAPRDSDEHVERRVAARLPLLEKLAPNATPHDILVQTIAILREGVGLSRVLIAVLTRDRTALRIKYAVGAEDEAGARSLTLDLTVPSLLGQLLQQPASLHITLASREQHWQRLPAPLRDLLDSGGLLAMSLFIGDKAVGIILADDGIGAPPPGEREYSYFKRVCSLAGKALESMSAGRS